MLAVNLLPWRAQRWRRQQQRSLLLLSGVLASTLLTVLLWWWHGDRLRRGQADALRDLTLTLAALQQQLSQQHALQQQRDALWARWQAAQQQQRAHQHWQRFWLQLPVLMPDTLWLSRLERRQGQLLLEGVAQSVAAVSDFRQRLRRQSLFTAVRQGSVQRQANGDYRFTLSARLQEVTDE